MPRSSFCEFAERGAQEPEEVEEQIKGDYEQHGDDDDGDGRMGRGEPGEPHGEEVFAEAESPVAERLRRHICGSAGAGFGAVRREGNATREQRGGPAPRLRGGSAGTESEQSRGGRTNERMDRLPHRIDERNFVGQKLHDVQDPGNAEHQRVAENLEMLGQLDHAEALKQTQGRDGGVEVQARRKPGSQDETDGFEGIHGRAPLRESEFMRSVMRRQRSARTYGAGKNGAAYENRTHA